MSGVLFDIILGRERFFEWKGGVTRGVQKMESRKGPRKRELVLWSLEAED
jgi:hypothetical protein